MASANWWVVQTSIASHAAGSVPVQTAVQSASKPKNSVAGPFSSQKAALAWINKSATSIPNPVSGLGNWLAGLGGDIASGMEQGFVSLLNDIWRGIRFQLGVTAGFIVLVIGLTYFFKDDIMNLIKLAGAFAK